MNDSTIDSQPNIRIKSLRYGELDRSVVVNAAMRVAGRRGVRFKQGLHVLIAGLCAM
ncbi:MAG: hypothetical protein WCC28_06920 [Mycobacterium sp.]|uniref:hypothetical protein n=1 Tax=Mycobacterium sp. TaxID=1785 RepID=UPI003C74B577